MKIKALIYDIEIEKGIRPSDPTKIIEGIQYCDGWRDFANMGISVICGYSYIDESYKVWLGDDLGSFKLALENHTHIVGFNNANFDDQLLKHLGIDLVDNYGLISFDLLRATWKCLGLGVDRDSFKKETHGGLGLENFAQLNLGLGKTGTGESAPVLWQQGHKSRVINYCLNDVKLTKLLFDKVIKDGYLLNPKDRQVALWLEDWLIK